MKRISHYPLDTTRRQTLRLPADAEVLGVGPRPAGCARYAVPDEECTWRVRDAELLGEASYLCLHVLHDVPVLNWQDRHFGMYLAGETVPEDIVVYLGASRAPAEYDHGHVFELHDGPPYRPDPEDRLTAGTQCLPWLERLSGCRPWLDRLVSWLSRWFGI